ncbi:hypothetical protein [Bythopirellula polymerisocia]|nr:hypothetical protein [Bythopirellula polymerisocia]
MAAKDCFSQMTPYIDIPDKEAKKEAEVLVFFEFVYFFMHLTNRSAVSHLTEHQIEKLHDYLGPFISSTAVDSFCAHWPKELKEGMIKDFYKKLNDAELEYSTCNELFSEENPLTGDSLFSKLARNVADLSDNSMNPLVLTLVIGSGVVVLKGLGLDALVKNTSRFLQ